MKRLVTTLVAFVILLTGVPPSKAQAPALNKVGQKVVKTLSKISLTSLRAALEVADEATRKDFQGIPQCFEKAFSEKSQFVAGTKLVDVTVNHTTSFWRGSVKQTLIMPCTATLAFELDQLRKNATFDLETRTIEVYLPPLSIIAVESHIAKCSADPEYAGLCVDWFDSGTADALELTLLKSDWGVLTRGMVEPNDSRLREVAKN